MLLIESLPWCSWKACPNNPLAKVSPNRGGRIYTLDPMGRQLKACLIPLSVRPVVRPVVVVRPLSVRPVVRLNITCKTSLKHPSDKYIRIYIYIYI
jgi:hypothetical protein